MGSSNTVLMEDYSDLCGDNFFPNVDLTSLKCHFENIPCLVVEWGALLY